jgi:NDP-sugar pyrophosphorylase family protein
MQALILATNEHVRLAPLTLNTPPALLPIGDRPVIALTLELLARAGIKHADVSLCQHGGAVVAYCGDGGRWGLRLAYFSHPQPLGTAGAIRVSAARVQETLLVLSAETIVDLDIPAALAFHQRSGCQVTLILGGAQPGSHPHPVVVADDRVHALTTAPGALPFTGALLCEPGALGAIPTGLPFDCYTDWLPQLLTSGVPVAAYTEHGYWNPLVDHADYAAAQQLLLSSAAALPVAVPLRAAYLPGVEVAAGIWVGLNTVIHPNARLSPPVWIGPDCRIGEDVELGPHTLIGANVLIDDGATVARSTILPRTYLGRLVHCDGRIVDQTTMIDPVSGVSVTIVDPFLAAALPVQRSVGALGLAFQRLLAALWLVLLAPLLLVLGLLVLVSTGRLLRSVQMVGLRPADLAAGVQPFALYSFAAADRTDRLTTVGRWLLSWEGERLPALWNVVRGDCALVGVRPLSVEQAAALTEEWQQARFARPAGLTGLWYVQDTGDDLDLILTADVYYVATSTWRAALTLLWRTPAAWRRSRNQRRTSRAEPAVARAILPPGPVSDAKE